MRNSFKELEEELISKHGEPPESVKENIDGTFRIFHFVGDILELFVSKLLKLIVSISGGTEEDNK